jgi:uncharacterized protein with PIN domain
MSEVKRRARWNWKVVEGGKCPKCGGRLEVTEHEEVDFGVIFLKSTVLVFREYRCRECQRVVFSERQAVSSGV